MPDVNDVINGLERCLVAGCNDCNQPDKSGYPWDCEGFDRMVNEAIAILKAQEPLKPVVDIDTCTCGNCGHTLEHQQLLGDNILFHEWYDYCPNCGRKVKWDA